MGVLHSLRPLGFHGRRPAYECHGLASTVRTADRFARTAQPQRWPYWSLARHPIVHQRCMRSTFDHAVAAVG